MIDIFWIEFELPQSKTITVWPVCSGAKKPLVPYKTRCIDGHMIINTILAQCSDCSMLVPKRLGIAPDKHRRLPKKYLSYNYN